MKKALALLLIAAAAFTLIACGDAESTKQTTAFTQSTYALSTTTDAENADIHSTKVLTQPYADIDFANGEIVEENGVLTFEYKTADGAEPAAVEEAEVSFSGKTKVLPVLRIKNIGAFVKATFNDFANAKEFDSFVEEKGGITIEVLYLDNSSVRTVRGIVCCTESIENGKASTRSGWGIAEDGGKPYFIAGNSDSNVYVSVYAQAEASHTELVHVVAVFDNTSEHLSLYVNGTLQDAKKTAGKFTSANKQEYFEKINMANIFYIGSDPTAQNHPEGDFPADDLIVADVKIYDKSLSKNEVTHLYSAASDLFE